MLAEHDRQGWQISLPQRPHSLFTMSLMSSPDGSASPDLTILKTPHPRQTHVPDSGLDTKVWDVTAERRQKTQTNGGARRDRTDDLMLAKHALSQLSYGPKGSSRQAERPVHGGPGTTRTSDLTLIRGAL
jgi:hypothetical protein